MRREVSRHQPAPLLDLFLSLAMALTEKPLKLTARGNLPTAFCTEVSGTYQPPHDPYSGRARATYSTVTEGRFWDLDLARAVASRAGLVHKRNGKLHITHKASERFLTAFPAIIAEAVPMFYQSAEEIVTTCYSLRALQRFLGFLGLAEYSWTPRPGNFHLGTLTRRPLLLEVIQFQVR